MQFLLAFLSLALAPIACFGLVVPGASTPSFYLVAVSSTTSSVLPVLQSGAFASLTGTGAPVEHYMYQGFLRGTIDRSGNPVLRPVINTGFSPTGSCATFGQLGYFDGSTNKCASYNTFGLQSDTENSQLGAQLTFNGVGGFYSCGATQDIWYKVVATDGPTDCTPVDLYTVPVI